MEIVNNPNSIDVAVGKKIKLKRKTLGLSQSSLSKTLGVTFQQVQKYENGSSRVSASRLYHLSLALNVPITYFFNDFYLIDENQENSTFPSVDNTDTEQLITKFYNLDAQSRKIITDFIFYFKNQSINTKHENNVYNLSST